MAGLGYYIREGISGFARNRSATFSAIAITTLVLFILSLFLLIIFNIREIIDEAKSEIAIYVYISEDYVDTELMKEKIYEVEGVESIDYISSEMAEQEFRKTFKEEADMLEVLDKNYFPASYRISVVEEMRDEDSISVISSKVAEIEGVSDVDYGEEWVEKVSGFEKRLKIVALVIGVLLGFINIIVVSNAIKLIILGRVEKISIIRLVGATDGFIKTPFIIEGLLIGVLGGIFSSAILYGILFILSRYGGFDFIFLPFTYLLSITVGGALLGMVASGISTSSYLRKLR